MPCSIVYLILIHERAMREGNSRIGVAWKVPVCYGNITFFLVDYIKISKGKII